MAIPARFCVLGHGKRKDLYHCALRIDLVRPHSQVATVLVCLSRSFFWELMCVVRSFCGTCIVVCHPERTSSKITSILSGLIYFSSALFECVWLVFTFVRLRRLGEKFVPLDRRSAVDSNCCLHTIPCLERAGLEHAADTSFSVT